MVSLNIVRRDLIRYWRNPVRTALLFALPLVMAAIFALAFGSGGTDQITIEVLLFNEDDGLLSMLLENMGGSSEIDQNLEIVPVGPEGYELMEQGEASALIHLPPDFTMDVLAGRPTVVQVVKNPSERFLPMVVEEGVRIGVVGLSEASRVFRPELQQISEFSGDSGAPSDLVVSSLSTGFNRKLGGAEQILFPPVMTLEAATVSAAETGESAPDVNILAYFLPGFSVMGILFLAQSATRDILLDRESGLLRHLLTAPVSSVEYLVGKCLSVFAVTAIGFGILVAVGLAAGVAWGPPLAVSVMVLASALSVGGLLLLIMSLVNSERQGDSLTTIVIIVSSMLGGAFIPTAQMPSFLRPVSALTVVFWATDGFSKLILEGLGLASVLTNVTVLVLSGALFMALGAVILHRKIIRGGA